MFSSRSEVFIDFESWLEFQLANMLHKSWQGRQAFFNQLLQIKNNLMFLSAVPFGICTTEKEMILYLQVRVPSTGTKL